jgi:tetratricopeptide (TPR) repeat protein
LRRLLPLVAVLVGGAMTYQAVRLWIADHRLHSDRLEIIEKAATLEPGNADAWDTLGRYQQLDFSNSDPEKALESYKRAVLADPHSATFRMNLAAAYESAGEVPKARQEFEKAREAYPLSAEVAWNYGNFLLRQDQDAAGYAEIQKAVRIDRSLLTLAISRTWRSSRDVNVLLNQVLPAEPEAYFQTLDFFSSIHQMDPAMVVWQRLTSLNQLLPLRRSFPFIDELVQQDRSTDAKTVWIGALGAADLPHDEPVNHSAVWNGLFTTDFQNGGLDWRYSPPPGVSLDFTSPPSGHDGRAVRMDFGGGQNTELSQPAEYVPVEPSSSYRFRASVQTQSISTESGMRFSITDPNHPNAVSILTENLTGTHEWQLVDTVVNTSPQTHFLLVKLYRGASRLFDNKLSGSVWIADVSMSPAIADSERPKQ